MQHSSIARRAAAVATATALAFGATLLVPGGADAAKARSLKGSVTGTVAGKVALGAFDLDDMRAGIRQPRGTERCRHRLLDRNDDNPFQWQHGRLSVGAGHAVHMLGDV